MTKGMAPLIAILFILALVFIIIGITDWSFFQSDLEKDLLPEKISQLPEMDLDEVETYEQYKDFADKTNALILILNEQGGFDIPPLETTQESWSKVSKKINKYGPLINNYQELVASAKKFENNKNEENYKEFYLNLGKFSLETTLISATLFHTAAFQTTGYIYRASGFNTWALKCPSCVSTVLTSVYWSIKTVLVEESSEIATEILDELEAHINETKNLQGIKKGLMNDLLTGQKRVNLS